MYVKKLTAVSKSGLELFMIKNNFATTKWNSSTFFSLNYSASYLTNVLTSSPNINMHSSKL